MRFIFLILVISTIFKKKMWCIEEGMVWFYVCSMQCSWSRRGWSHYFLAGTLIQKTDQAAGIQVLRPEPGSQRHKVRDPDDPDGEENHAFHADKDINVISFFFHHLLHTRNLCCFHYWCCWHQHFSDTKNANVANKNFEHVIKCQCWCRCC